MNPLSCPVVHAEKNLVIIISKKKQTYSLNLLPIMSLFNRYIYQRCGDVRKYITMLLNFFGALFLSKIVLGAVYLTWSSYFLFIK
jgi:hypothetical protein